VLRALQALSLQTLPASEFEVIVSIDGSSDRTSDLVAQFAAPYPLRTLWQPNAGRASACNSGILASRGELAVLLDDDMEPLPGCLQAHCRAHAGARSRAVMGAVPVRVDEHSPLTAKFIRDRFEKHSMKLAQPDYRIGFRDFYSGNLSIPRNVLIEVGLFDPAFVAYGNEDGELALRLFRAGVELVYSKEAAATQHYEKEFEALARDNAAKGRTAVLCLQKHPETIGSLQQRLYQHGSWKWWIIRRLLLAITAALQSTPGLVIRFIHWQERRRAPQLHRYYRLALDYFFWLGAGPELKLWRRQQGTGS
jgi:GT2 family glycosyltransferase